MTSAAPQDEEEKDLKPQDVRKKRSASHVKKLKTLRNKQDIAAMQLKLYSGPQDRNQFFKELSDGVDSSILDFV